MFFLLVGNGTGVSHGIMESIAETGELSLLFANAEKGWTDWTEQLVFGKKPYFGYSRRPKVLVYFIYLKKTKKKPKHINCE